MAGALSRVRTAGACVSSATTVEITAATSDSTVEDDRVWMTCTCGAAINPSADDD
jgi:hypothetical protein